MNPTLRFVTSDPIDWYQVSIKDLVYPIKSGKSKKSDNGDYVLYGATGIIGLTNDVYNDDSLILAARVGSVGNVSLRHGKFGVSDNVLVIKPKENSNISFIYHLLVTKVNWKSLSNGTSQSVVSAKKVEAYKVYVSSLKEQQKIAAFFTALDEKIRLSEQKLNLISKIKKGIAQKLFAQDLRFKNKDGYFFDSWKSYTVGELVDVIGGGTPSTQNPDYWDGDIYWLTPTEINSKYVHSSNRKITFDGVRNSSAKLLPKGALLLTTRATLGACSINNQDNPVCTNQGFQSLVCKDGVDNEFMYYVVTDSAFQKTMIQRASGSTFLEISSKNLKGIVIHLPSLEEQRQIATLLSSLDKKIDCLKQRVKAFKTQKASFMQQMFV